MSLPMCLARIVLPRTTPMASEISFPGKESVVTVTFGVPRVVGPFELGEVTFDRPVQRRPPRLARTVDARHVPRKADHGTAIIRIEAS